MYPSITSKRDIFLKRLLGPARVSSVAPAAGSLRPALSVSVSLVLGAQEDDLAGHNLGGRALVAVFGLPCASLELALQVDLPTFRQVLGELGGLPPRDDLPPGVR